MRKRIVKSLIATMLITSIMSVTVLADDVTDLKNQQSQVQKELDKTESEMAYLLVQMDNLEMDISELSAKIVETEEQLAEAEVEMDKQYEDMKLRIKYMYEEQSSTLSEAFFGSENMGEILNKAEYVQQVYDYDRSKLEDMAAMAAEIQNLKTTLESDMAVLEQKSSDLTAKQALLYSTIEDLKDKVDDYDDKIEEAVRKAAEKAAAEAAKQNNITIPTTANNDSAVASAVVALAYKYIGVPYVYGGATPSGFDCSGLTSYIYKQVGISIPRSSSVQSRGGQAINGLANAKPGDIICYPGHVALYIGNGQVIHAPYPGQKVKIASATMMTITSIRRYW